MKNIHALENILAVIQNPSSSSQNMNTIIIVVIVIIIIVIASILFGNKK